LLQKKTPQSSVLKENTYVSITNYEKYDVNKYVKLIYLFKYAIYVERAKNIYAIYV
jgi:hypothetical protein